MMKPIGVFLTILLYLNGSVGGQEPAPVEKPNQTNQATSTWLNSRLATSSIAGEAAAYVRVPYLDSLFVQENPLGIVVEPLAPELAAQLQIKPQGLVVTGVNDGSLAATAGLQRFDILLKAGDSELKTPEDLKSLSVNQPGVSWKFLIRRAGKDLVVPLQVARDSNLLPLVIDINADRQPVTTTKQYRIGVVLASVDDVLRSHIPILKENGVLITEVKSDSPAEKVGIEKNDVILEIHGKPVDSEQSVRDQIQGNGEKEVALKLLRRGKAIEVKVQPTVLEEPFEEVNVMSSDIFFMDIQNAQALRRNIYYEFRSGANAESELGEIKTLLKQLSEKIDALQAKH